MPGKGSFTAGNAGAGQARRQSLLEKMTELLRELRYLGVGREELERLIKEEYDRD